MDTEHIEISNGDLFFTDGFGITHHIGTLNFSSGGLIDFASDSDVKDNKESDRDLPDNISDELDGFLNSFRRKFDEYVKENC